jgi:hypothetical protein
LHGFLKVFTDLFVSTLGAELVNEREAFRVDELDIVPPFVFFTSLFQFSVEARLSDVFSNNLFTFDGSSV